MSQIYLAQRKERYDSPKTVPTRRNSPTIRAKADRNDNSFPRPETGEHSPLQWQLPEQPLKEAPSVHFNVPIIHSAQIASDGPDPRAAGSLRKTTIPVHRAFVEGGTRRTVATFFPRRPTPGIPGSA